jgi:large subunit ribosomal protein L33
MKGRAATRLSVVLVCSACGTRNYKTTKRRQDGAPPLILKKFCSTCNAHTEHVETK